MGTQLTVSDLRHQTWALMVQQQMHSGLTVKQWCHENQISLKTFYYRRRLVQDNLLQAVSSTNPFVEVTPSAPCVKPLPLPGATSDQEPFHPELTLSVRDVVIGITRETSKTLLADVLEVIRNA